MTFRIQPHMRLHEWVADEAGFFRDEGLDYEFEDVVGRNFRQPPEGLGFDGSPVAHMWRTMIWPNNFL